MKAERAENVTLRAKDCPAGIRCDDDCACDEESFYFKADIERQNVQRMLQSSVQRTYDRRANLTEPTP